MSPHSWNPQAYQDNAGFVPRLGAEILSWLDPKPGEAILDLGCGDGALTARIASAGCRVTGIDQSQAMVDAARARGLTVHVADAQDRFEALGVAAGGFDAVFSNAALHWMKRDPAQVAHNVALALAPGGRFAAEFGGFGNVGAITTALLAACRLQGVDGGARHPWYFPTERAYTRVLEAAGLTVARMALVPRPVALPTDMAGWLNTFAGPFTAGLEPGTARAILDDATGLMATALKAEDGVWSADYVRLRVLAQKPLS